MRINTAMVAAMRERLERRTRTIPPSTHTLELAGQALLDHLYPIQPYIDRVRDKDRTTWRRCADDREVWTTAGRSRAVTSRRLWDSFGPLTWEGYGE